MTLLLTMLIGLLRLRLDRGMFRLGRLLWTQVRLQLFSAVTLTTLLM
jgi:hypothetical protein